MSKRSSRRRTPCLALRRNTLGAYLDIGKTNEAMNETQKCCMLRWLVVENGFRQRLSPFVVKLNFVVYRRQNSTFCALLQKCARERTKVVNAAHLHR